MGQACCADDIQVEYKGNMINEQSELFKSQTSKKEEPKEMNVPLELPVIPVPKLNEKVESAMMRMKEFDSLIENYERGVYSKPRRINALGVIYEGEWKLMAPHGKGKMYFPDGSYYHGYFYNGVPNGEGRLINSFGISYQGEVRNGKATGTGELLNLSREYHYQGEWVNDKPHGKGKETFGDHSEFEGRFNNGIKEGEGIYRKFNDFEYKGNFSNNVFEGFGEISYANGDSYAGQWKNGLFHGEGTYIYGGEKSEKYIGQYQEGLKHGKGSYLDAEGRVFEGFWELGKRKGKGKIYEKNEIIEWNWNNDRPLKKVK